MDVLWIAENGGPRPDNAAALAASKGFLWIDADADDVTPDPEAWREEIERLTGEHLHDLHLQDAINPVHPSYFDNTATYEMVVFRRIVTDVPTSETRIPGNGKTGIPLLASLRTQPVSFFVLKHALISVRHGHSTTCEEMKRRLAEQRGEIAPVERRERSLSSIGPLGRPPSGPAELMLRLLNGMVDKYLALRQPLTLQLDRWQRELLNPNGRFRNWLALLDARIVLRRLENISEEQYDALSELRDAAMDRSDDAWGSGAFDHRRDALLVRINDVMEHVNRVLSHARRMESSVENAVQLHFSATAHRTNEIMRILTVVTVIFMPLTLITGIFGMNVDDLPMVHERGAFWWIIVGMVVLALLLWIWFSARRFLETRPYRVAEALARKAGLRAGRSTDDTLM
ncbi:MAG: magnesium transporter CorA family protein [Pigmentiphaga sp.]|uniref:magnesium transporter CorA family protein n=1 Tax=Pigmentiphaga sp. TaxID=1977564 RepID=UPI0029ADCFF4|nr:magnesium transporter CorA family protein [Pigmentiphaga sp.]MDX3906945.1 magnesium transporter CorA family protein [Pigmentiphaga sp.]